MTRTKSINSLNVVTEMHVFPHLVLIDELYELKFKVGLVHVKQCLNRD